MHVPTLWVFVGFFESKPVRLIFQLIHNMDLGRDGLRTSEDMFKVIMGTLDQNKIEQQEDLKLKQRGCFLNGNVSFWAQIFTNL